MIYILLILLLICAAILFLPIPFFIKISKADKSVSGRIVIAGLIPISFPRAKKKVAVKAKVKVEEKKKKAGKKRISIDTDRLVKELLDGSFRKRVSVAVYRLLKRTLFSLRIRIKSGNVTYGTGDPAETGIILGRYYALRYTALQFIDFGEKFSLTPDFIKKRQDFDITAIIKIFPGKILLAAFIFLFEWPLYRTLKLFKLEIFSRKQRQG